jgi:hypothetical protein
VGHCRSQPRQHSGFAFGQLASDCFLPPVDLFCGGLRSLLGPSDALLKAVFVPSDIVLVERPISVLSALNFAGDDIGPGQSVPKEQSGAQVGSARPLAVLVGAQLPDQFAEEITRFDVHEQILIIAITAANWVLALRSVRLIIVLNMALLSEAETCLTKGTAVAGSCQSICTWLCVWSLRLPTY